MRRLLGLLLVSYSCLNVSAAAFHRKDEGLKERIGEYFARFYSHPHTVSAQRSDPLILICFSSAAIQTKH